MAEPGNHPDLVLVPCRVTWESPRGDSGLLTQGGASRQGSPGALPLLDSWGAQSPAALGPAILALPQEPTSHL